MQLAYDYERRLKRQYTKLHRLPNARFWRKAGMGLGGAEWPVLTQSRHSVDHLSVRLTTCQLGSHLSALQDRLASSKILPVGRCCLKGDAQMERIISETAQGLIQVYGENARIQADLIAARMAGHKTEHGQTIWNEVAKAIKKLQP